MRRAVSLRVVGGLSLIALGCATGGGAPAGEAPAGPVRVEVANNSTHNVVVYAIYRGQRSRVGEVTPLGSGSFQLPPGLDVGGAGVRFLVDAIGSTERYVSQELFLSRGDAVAIRVQPSLRQTSVSVR